MAGRKEGALRAGVLNRAQGGASARPPCVRSPPISHRARRRRRRGSPNLSRPAGSWPYVGARQIGPSSVLGRLDDRGAQRPGDRALTVPARPLEFRVAASVRQLTLHSNGNGRRPDRRICGRPGRSGCDRARSLAEPPWPARRLGHPVRARRNPPGALRSRWLDRPTSPRKDCPRRRHGALGLRRTRRAPEAGPYTDRRTRDRKQQRHDRKSAREHLAVLLSGRASIGRDAWGRVDKQV